MFRYVEWVYKKNPVWPWLKNRFALTLQHEKRFSWQMIITMWIASCIAMMIRGLGNPTGFGLGLDLGIYIGFNTVLFCLSAYVLAFVLTMMYVPVPRLLLSSVLYTGYVVFYILDDANLGLLFSTIVSVSYTVLAVLIAFTVAVILQHRIGLHWKMICSVLTVSLVLSSVWILSNGDHGRQIVSEDDQETGHGEEYMAEEDFEEEHVDHEEDYADPITPLQMESPAEPGPYSYRYFTYGSGKDKHRVEFGADAELISKAVDASPYINNWQWARTMFWGFDETELPLNGRVWMPEGEGPFPLVLIVHGNHRMEYFSDDGYGYLGELLASRGFVVVSVDQNFINYSSWSKTPNQDMILRAWVLMQHLLEIQRLQDLPDTPFYQRVDFEQTALVGHSRGGLAAAMAVDRSKWFASDPTLAGMEQINIQAVVGLAPTDRKVDGEVAELEDVYYLVLHGALDADVNSFRGDRTYGRTSFTEGSDRFKASVYIAEANHSQFNTDWGRMDINLPGGLFLNRNSLMDAALQREIAKVYISAFLETALYGKEQYTDLFRDFRYGRDWLPDTQYVSRFENGMFSPLLDFDRMKKMKEFYQGSKVEAEGFSTWEVEEAKDRRRNEKGTAGVVLEWEDNAQYMIELSTYYREERLTEKPDSFIFSMANMERDLDLEDVEDVEDAGEVGEVEHADRQATAVPYVDLEIETEGAGSVQIALDELLPVEPPIYTQYTLHPWFDDIMRNGKFSEATEPVFQTYELPMAVLQEKNPDFRPEAITKIHLHFSNGPGKVMLDDIGFIRF